MAITETQKSRTIRARVKNPPALSKPRAKPGPKPKNGPHTAAHFERDERRRDLMYHNWTEVFDYMEDNKDDSQRKVVAYFATRLDAKGGKLFFTQSALLVAEDPNARSMKRARIVTCPEVDAALALWARDMEQKRLEYGFRNNIREATIDELLDPPIVQEDFDSEVLHFADGEEGTREILEYLKLRDEDDQDEEDLQEPEFQFSKQEALNAVAFLQNIAHHRPDLDVALPLVGQLRKFRSALAQEMEEGKVQTTITSFFK
ncbi:hypothetical protein B0H14DRAFT_3523917 [Mycena olivaceomarginata]|nr:hypothetical protein B0H14DRAFT_3523917 [Mycena olivaceomarginata]